MFGFRSDRITLYNSTRCFVQVRNLISYGENTD
jgi:hypothetical protein